MSSNKSNNYISTKDSQQEKSPELSALPEEQYSGLSVNSDSTVRAILNSRGKEYGSFNSQANIAQGILSFLRLDPNKWMSLSNVQRSSLEMISHKLSRIVNGNPNHIDSWQDIAGYATLVVEHIKSTAAQTREK